MSFQFAVRRNDPRSEQRDRELEDYLSGVVRSTDISNIRVLSAAEYAALSPPDPFTLYFVV